MKILIIYDYFYPAYKSGGISQSLFNLFNELESDMEVEVLCGKRDLDGSKLKYDNYLSKVHYSSRLGVLKNLYKSNLSSSDSIYLNGVFSPFFFVLPLLYFKLFHNNKVKLVIAPRGMLQQGALRIRSRKKNIYLYVLKLLGFFKNIRWLATDEQEYQDIVTFAGKNASVCFANDVPKKPFELPSFTIKNQLQIIFLSLITEKKNLHLIIESLMVYSKEIIFHIYGPVKDNNYWKKCQLLIKKLPGNVTIEYMGSIMPDQVQKTMTEYHSLILPSKGENFGHAIYEALSVGRPVIISSNTPWKNLYSKSCGWNVDLNYESVLDALNQLNSLSQKDYDIFCFKSNELAKEFYYNADFRNQYKNLFSL